MKTLGTTKTITEVEYRDLENLFEEEYNLDERFSFQADQMIGNDSISNFNVDKKADLDKWNAKKLEEFKNGTWHDYMTDILLQDLVNREVIAPAEYIISMSY